MIPYPALFHVLGASKRAANEWRDASEISTNQGVSWNQLFWLRHHVYMSTKARGFRLGQNPLINIENCSALQ